MRALVLAILLVTCSIAQAQRERAAELVRTGNAYLQSGDRGSSIGYFREAIDADPRCGPAYAGLGQAYRARGSLEEAREALETGTVQAPDHAPIYLELTRTLIELHRPDDAASVLRELVHRDPENIEGLVMLAELARQRGPFLEALAVERHLLALAARDRLDAARTAEARRYENALLLLVAPIDPVTAPRACNGSPVRRALAHCR